MTKEQRRAIVKQAADRVMPGVSAVLQGDAAIVKAMQNPMKIDPREWVVSLYESGWYVEKPDPKAPLEDCKFIQVNGPFNTKEDAEKVASAYRNAWVLPAAYKFAAKLRGEKP